jgi:FkbM family methyltransferase
VRPRRGAVRIVDLPWNLPLEVDSSETIGVGIWHHGIFDLPVVEAIFRLVDPTDILLDVGANVGYMTSAALASGARRVLSFEPHPDLFARLSRNVGRCNDSQPRLAGRVEVQQKAMSAKSGRAMLHVPKLYFRGNQGISTLELTEDRDNYFQIDVITTTLDRVIEELGEPIGVLKIDIEGHELQAFCGGRESLASDKIRDIIYEDAADVASEVSSYLRSFGYSIYRLEKTLFGPVLRDQPLAVLPSSPPNLLATLSPDRARNRMAGRGYRCLRPVPAN